MGASKSELAVVADVVRRGNGFFLKRTLARADLKKNMDTFLAFLCSFDWTEWYMSKRPSKGFGVEFKVRGQGSCESHVNSTKSLTKISNLN